MLASASKTRLWLALRFPHLPAEAQGIAGSALEVVIDKHKVSWASEPALAAGVRLGMDTTTAQLLAGALPRERDSTKEGQQLQTLAELLYQFTPHIEIYQSKTAVHAGLLLEISSCLVLFGGVLSLTQKIMQTLVQNACVLGLGHSQPAAWLLSFSSQVITGHECRENFIAQINQLPIELLVDFPKQVDALEKTGFRVMGDLAKHIQQQKIAPFRKRWGHEFADYLWDVFGEDAGPQGSLFDASNRRAPVNYFKPQEQFNEELQFDFPLHKTEQLELPMEMLLKKLAGYLRKRQQQTQHIHWGLADIYRNHEGFSVYADTPQMHWELLFNLSLIQLENRDLPFEVDRLQLSCGAVFPAQNTSAILAFDQGDKNHKSFTLAAARLKARLGDLAVYKLSYKDSYLPEVSNQAIGLAEKSQQQLPDYHRHAARPAWLLDAPYPIEMRAQGLYWRGLIRLIAGPERIQGLWWNSPSARDYFVGERFDQQRLWVFWDLHKQQWFVQGVFA